ncbi:hypothetical protein EVAR_3102_1 [Eumeta japonica]|uniref:Uncharacterized protein n=1 Tax=Eumeta variegata TaxID=151549 RepID=A0A4C1XH22_EUMVA|nr:hypothetical protein EVAR_3102_1 [Eumeta japonica]
MGSEWGPGPDSGGLEWKADRTTWRMDRWWGTGSGMGPDRTWRNGRDSGGNRMKWNGEWTVERTGTDIENRTRSVDKCGDGVRIESGTGTDIENRTRSVDKCGNGVRIESGTRTDKWGRNQN